MTPRRASCSATVLRGRTSVVTYRPSTVRAADRIVVLGGGRIIAQGEHAALPERGGHYATLYATHFRHRTEVYAP